MSTDNRGDAIADGAGRALHLLDREPPPDYLRDWTERIAAEKEVVDPGSSSALVFQIGIEWLALPTPIFQEVAEDCVVHGVPHRGGGTLAGIVNIRGELLLCASLAALLGIETPTQERAEKTRPSYERLLVANRHGNRLAFPIDQVHGVARYHSRDLKPVPSTLVKAAAAFTLGMLTWENRTVGLLDDELLFHQLDKSFR